MSKSSNKTEDANDKFLANDQNVGKSNAITFNVICRVCLGVMLTFLTATTVVGYQALLPTLRAEGVLSSLCSSHQNSTAPPTCEAQAVELDLMFTLSVSFLNFGCLPSGWLVANWGARYSCLLGGLLVSVGWGLFALSDNITFPMYVPGYVLAGLGSGPILFSMYTLASLSPENSGTIMTLVVAGINLASLVLVAFANIYTISGISLRYIILGYLIFPVTLMGMSFWLFPPSPCCGCLPKRQQKQDPAESGVDSTPLMHGDGNFPPGENAGTNDTDKGQPQSKIAKDDDEKEDDKSHGKETKWFVYSSLTEALSRRQVWVHLLLVTVWSSANMTSLYYYIQNIDEQLLALTNSTAETDTGDKVFCICSTMRARSFPIFPTCFDKQSLMCNESKQ